MTTMATTQGVVSRVISAAVNSRNTSGPVSRNINVAVVGQSIADFGFNDPALNDPTIGIDTFTTTLQNYFDTVTTVNCAKGGIAIRNANAGSAGAYLDASDARSSDYTLEVTDAITAAGLTNAEIDHILIIIGNTDAAGIDAGSSTQAETETSYRAFVSILEQDFPNATISMAPLGADTNSNEFTGYREFGQIESELLNDNTLRRSPSYVMGPYRDDTHLNDAGAANFWENLGENVAAQRGRRSLIGTLGPSVTSLSFDLDNNLLYVNYDLDGANTITQADTTSLETNMFVFNVDGTLRGCQFAVLERDNNRIRCRITSYTIQDGDNITLNCMNTTFRNANLTLILEDSEGLPLQKRTDITAVASSLSSDLETGSYALTGFDGTSEIVDLFSDLEAGSYTLTGLDGTSSVRNTFSDLETGIYLTLGFDGTSEVIEPGGDGLASVASVGANVVAEWWAHLSACVASDTAETIADLGGDTNFDFWNGNDSGTGDNCTITNSGTSAGIITATGTGDNLTSQQQSSVATDWGRMCRSDQDGSLVFVFRTPSTIGTAFYLNAGSTGANPDIRVLSVGGNMEYRASNVSGSFANTNLGSLAADTDYIVVVSTSGATLTYAMNSTTFSAGTNLNTNTTNVSGTTRVFTNKTGGTGATGAGLYGMAILDTDLTNSQLSDIVDYINNNTPLNVT